MKAFFLTILAASLSLFLSHALADAPEFLIPVTGSEEAMSRVNNPYFLKKETYFAKQYRIVKVNTELLLNADQIKISLFDDLSATLQVTITISVDVQSDGLSINWKGHFIEPTAPVSVDDLVAEGANQLRRDETIKVFILLSSLQEISKIDSKVFY